MATATDAARVLVQKHKEDALTIARSPSGIEPGYDPTTGITWDESGRARYRKGGGVVVVGQGCSLNSGDQNVATGTPTILEFDDIGEVFYADDGYFDLGAGTLISVANPGRYLFFMQAAVLLAPGTKAELIMSTDGLNAALLEETSYCATTNAEASNSIMSLSITLPWLVTAGGENYWMQITHGAGFTAAVSFAFAVTRLS